MKYQANPVIVDAFKIVSVGAPDPLGMRSIRLDGRESIYVATPEMCARMEPSVGDYWVIQSDGYIYLNPKEVFERKYHLIEENASAAT